MQSIVYLHLPAAIQNATLLPLRYGCLKTHASTPGNSAFPGGFLRQSSLYSHCHSLALTKHIFEYLGGRQLLSAHRLDNSLRQPKNTNFSTITRLVNRSIQSLRVTLYSSVTTIQSLLQSLVRQVDTRYSSRRLRHPSWIVQSFSQ